MRFRFEVLAIALALSAFPAAQTQQRPAAPRASGIVQSETTAILVDVVVRDKKGQPVTDLTDHDFELYEDGVQQDIGALTRYTSDTFADVATSSTPAPERAPTFPAAKPPAEPTPEPIIALIFEKLSPEARVIARKAALGYLGERGQTDARIAVFGIDLSLVTYQTYTRDAALLKKAIADVGVRSFAQFESHEKQARQLGQQATGAANAMGALQAGGPGAAQAAQSGGGAGAADAMIAQMQQRTLETFDMLERDEQGLSTTNALMAVVNSMRGLPGRKSVVLFSEGVAIPANVAARFGSVIDNANRANVSIYTMDAAGLRAESQTQETADSVNAAARRMLGRNPTSDVVGRPMTEALEQNENTLRRDPHSGLGQLSEGTGGVVIGSTNDLTGGLKRIDQDMRNYYMLSYVPKNDKFDGKFRAITVKVKRGGVDVASRKGYYAVRSAGPTPIMSYEARPLALLDSTPLPNAFPSRAAALRFPEASGGELTPVLVSVPGSAITFVTTEDKTSYKAEFTIVVRFRNAASQVVDKMSQSYVLTGPIDKLDGVKQSNVLFYRERELKPGLYTMESIVHDVTNDKASARVVTIEERQLDPATLRASDLVLISRAERVAKADQRADNPFQAGDMLLYPNLGEPLKKSTTPELGFFFTAYPAKGTKLQATLQVLQNGAQLAALPLTLDTPDASGRVEQVSRLPIGSLATGTYDLRVVLSDGRQQIARSTTFRLVD